MPDVWSSLAQADVAMQEMLANVLEAAGSGPWRDTLESFVADIDLPPKCRILEVGCGTGRVVRTMARARPAAQIIGIDPAPVLIEKAREMANSLANVSFEEMDGRRLDFPDGEFDVVVIVRTLMHAEQPEQVLTEAFRVLRPGGTLAVHEADGDSVTVAAGAHDPLQNCLEAFKAAFLNDAWIVPRMPALLKGAGFEVPRTRSYGLMQASQPEMILNQLGRGADVLAVSGRIGQDLAEALKQEARQRVEAGRFHGFMVETTFITRKPS